MIDCGPLEDLANGDVITLGGTTLNQVARYFCDEGYNLIGLESRVCVSPGTWSGSAPSCQCELPAQAFLEACALYSELSYFYSPTVYCLKIKENICQFQ